MIYVLLPFFLVHLFLAAYFQYEPPVLNEQEYQRMPLLNHFEDFEGCREYCVGHVYLLQNYSDPALWKVIRGFSDNKFHYRHDYLKRGVCLDGSLGKPERRHINFAALKTHTLRLVNSSLKFIVTNEQQTKTEAYINDVTLPTGLAGFVNVSLCVGESLRSSWKEKSLLDWLFLVIVFGLICLVVQSSIERHQGKVDARTDIFSLQSSWQVFRDNSRQSTTFSGIKCASLWSSVFSHSFAAMSGFFLLDAFRIEDGTHRMASVMIYSMYFYIPGVFFVLSGYFCSTHLLRATSIPVFDLICAKFKKFTPLTGLVCLFLASCYIKLNFTPIWLETAGNEKLNCRNNGWKNLFFLNNLWNSEESCLIQTWTVAVEVQLYVFTVILLKLSASSGHKHLTKALLVLLALSLSAWVFLGLKYEAVGLPLGVESTRHQRFYDTEFHKIYIKPYTNASYWICGMLLAVFRLQSTHNLFQRSSYMVMYSGLLVLATFPIILCAYLISKTTHEPPVWLILMTTVTKHLCILPALTVLGARSSESAEKPRPERAIRGFGWVNSAVKLNFSVFMTHLPLINVILATVKKEEVALGLMSTRLMLSSLGFGFFCYFFFEQPFNRLVEFLTSKKKLSEKHD